MSSIAQAVAAAEAILEGRLPYTQALHDALGGNRPTEEQENWLLRPEVLLKNYSHPDDRCLVIPDRLLNPDEAVAFSHVTAPGNALWDRAFRDAFESVLTTLAALSEEKEPISCRFRARLCAACHDELRDLLDEYAELGEESDNTDEREKPQEAPPVFSLPEGVVRDALAILNGKPPKERGWQVKPHAWKRNIVARFGNTSIPEVDQDLLETAYPDYDPADECERELNSRSLLERAVRDVMAAVIDDDQGVQQVGNPRYRAELREAQRRTLVYLLSLGGIAAPN